MSELSAHLGALRDAGREWDELHQLMRSAAQGLEDAAVAGLPASVRGAASGFLSAWASYARESDELATGFVDGLAASAAAYGTADDAGARGFRALDGRAGEKR